jgi:hypothetical protein
MEFLKNEVKKRLNLAFSPCALNSEVYFATAVCKVVRGIEIIMNMDKIELNAPKSAGLNLWATSS